MFYELTVKGHIRIPPAALREDVREVVLKKLNEGYEGFMSSEIGFAICVTELLNISDGIIIPGDGAAYYETEFKLLAFKPEMQEVVLGKITDIANFGAFVNIGPIEGMIHVSQTMDDYVSFSKQGNVLQGKESKNVLKINDKCKARIIALSYKDPVNPKIGLTMRQPFLGALNWLEDKKEKKKKKIKWKY